MSEQEFLDGVAEEIKMIDLCKSQHTLALRVAAVMHDGQLDDSGKLYIEHPLRISLALDRDDDKAVALLHDVIEDTPATAEWLIALGFDEDIVTSIVHLTREIYEDGTKEVYSEFIDRCCLDDRARRVKRRDIEDNLIPSRLKKLPKEQQLKLKQKYRKALNQIEAYEIKMKTN